MILGIIIMHIHLIMNKILLFSFFYTIAYGACRSTLAGTEYAVVGGPSMTVTGRTCQRWDTIYPHYHTKPASMFAGNITNVTDIANWCRNQGGETPLWCYTTDPYVKWQTCDVPFCNGELKWHFILEISKQDVCMAF